MNGWRNPERNLSGERLVWLAAPLSAHSQVVVYGKPELLPKLLDRRPLENDHVASIHDFTVEYTRFSIEGYRCSIALVLHHDSIPASRKNLILSTPTYHIIESLTQN